MTADGLTELYARLRKQIVLPEKEKSLVVDETGEFTEAGIGKC